MCFLKDLLCSLNFAFFFVFFMFFGNKTLKKKNNPETKHDFSISLVLHVFENIKQFSKTVNKQALYNSLKTKVISMISPFKSLSLNCEKSQSHSHLLVTIYIDYRCSSLSIILRSIYFVDHSCKFSIYQELQRPIWLMLLRTIFENTKNTKKVFSETLLFYLNLVFFVFFRKKKNKETGNQTCL